MNQHAFTNVTTTLLTVLALVAWTGLLTRASTTERLENSPVVQHVLKAPALFAE